MITKELILIDIDDSNLISDFNYLSENAFICTSNLSGFITAHYSRPLIKITNNVKNKSIIRKVRAESIPKLTINNIALDYLNRKELDAEVGDELIISNTNLFESAIIYPFKHPDQNVRIIFKYLIISIIISAILSKIFNNLS